jgi:GTP pyrophosphokinase
LPRPEPPPIFAGNMLRQYQLVEKVLEYDPDADEAMLNRAYV